ncbi:hypothetical protein EV363DRAFT_1300110 [Boletus edulis]|nr:hypothetical protein EV363DRAFT_1300110 [Boletus edulis]
MSSRILEPFLSASLHIVAGCGQQLLYASIPLSLTQLEKRLGCPTPLPLSRSGSPVYPGPLTRVLSRRSTSLSRVPAPNALVSVIGNPVARSLGHASLSVPRGKEPCAVGPHTRPMSTKFSGKLATTTSVLIPRGSRTATNECKATNRFIIASIVTWVTFPLLNYSEVIDEASATGSPNVPPTRKTTISTLPARSCIPHETTLGNWAKHAVFKRDVAEGHAEFTAIRQRDAGELFY